MKKVQKIKPYSWYIHPGMLDTAIEIVSINEDSVVVAWYNISGHQRKFSLGLDFLNIKDFDRSPLWVEQGDWISELPNMDMRY